MTITPGDLIGIVADGREGEGAERFQFAGLRMRKGSGGCSWISRQLAQGQASRKLFPGIDTTAAVAPLDDEFVVAFFAQRQWPQWFRTRQRT